MTTIEQVRREDRIERLAKRLAEEIAPDIQSLVADVVNEWRKTPPAIKNEEEFAEQLRAETCKKIGTLLIVGEGFSVDYWKA